jgi:hypothetical protein
MMDRASKLARYVQSGIGWAPSSHSIITSGHRGGMLLPDGSLARERAVRAAIVARARAQKK